MIYSVLCVVCAWNSDLCVVASIWVLNSIFMQCTDAWGEEIGTELRRPCVLPMQIIRAISVVITENNLVFVQPSMLSTPYCGILNGIFTDPRNIVIVLNFVSCCFAFWLIFAKDIANNNNNYETQKIWLIPQIDYVNRRHNIAQNNIISFDFFFCHINCVNHQFFVLFKALLFVLIWRNSTPFPIQFLFYLSYDTPLKFDSHESNYQAFHFTVLMQHNMRQFYCKMRRKKLSLSTLVVNYVKW